ncbi:hypothetical protein BJY01DRAFT_238447 [Aspergillus pseudoustus]|uniref:Protein-tyrosine phosphatase-like protein n=1 Tax=Aspergillus pseudoustus TaxID=1810923 RepID=A0ABR4J7V3_9EURO
MSAMTGPRSPTSPWHQESQTLTLPGPSSPTTFFPLSDSRPSSFTKISPRAAAPEVPDSNYFSFNLESPSLFKNRDHLSPVQSNDSPEGQLIFGKDVAGAQHVSFGVRPGSEGGTPDSAVYRLSLNRGIGKRELDLSRPPKHVSIQSTETTEASGRPVSIERCAELLASFANDVMLLDVRPYAHFARGNIRGALNLCIPTTLLKRPSFDTKKLANTFTDEADRLNFVRWKTCRYIIVYDAATASMKDAGPLVNVLRKFSVEGWTGDGLILMGGFRTFSTKFPQLTQKQQQALSSQSKKVSPMQIDLPQSAPVAGGCSIPESSSAAIPFFGNIRQNMDLVGGVGQIALKHSEHLSESERRSLPPWLYQVSDPSDQGRMAASRFFDIEKIELERMRRALSYDHNNISSSNQTSNETFRVAGIEKGTKNRYNDIYPYEHTRVRLHDIPSGGCDYVNASYMKAEHSDRYYIATQAPVPDTFSDFWRVVWEQDIRLVVSLTAEVERGQVKCHPYWKSGAYGPFYVNNFSKQYIPMEPVDSPQANSRSPVDSEDSTIVVRHFGLSHSGTSGIFPVLRSRAAKQLCDSQFNTNCATFEFGDIRPNVKASSLALYGDDTLIFNCTAKAVHIFRVGYGQVALISSVKLPWIQSGLAEILKTAFDGHDLIYILHRFTPDVEEPDSSQEHPFIKQARDFGDDGQTVYLTCHSLQAPDEPVRVCAFPEHADCEPSALAVADDGGFAISWCHRILPTHSVVYYTVKPGSEYDVGPNLVGFFHTPRPLHKWHGNTRGPLITEMAFNDRSSQLLYTYQAKTLYASFQKIDRTGSPTLYENSNPVDFTDDLSLLFSIGVPFFGTHETSHQNGLEVCRWRYLSLGIATHREENWTVACLLRSEATCRARNCGHQMNLERGRRLQDWTVMTRLWGFRDATDSLGCKVAASKLGTRIAVANWNVIYVWALEPGALIDGDPEGYYGPMWRSANTGQIELHPVVLKLDAVCFQLRFTDRENEVVAITDRGIMLWDLAPPGRGSRSRRQLDIGNTV